MTIADIQLLYEYDRWANHRVLQAASTLSDDQFTRDLGGSFPSVRDTVVHLISGEWIWVNYWGGPSDDPAFFTELKTRREALFNPALYPNIAAVRAKWAEVEKQQVDFVNAITEKALAELHPARKTRLSLMHLMQHLANHSTYHRGQVALMMRQLGAEPLSSDFHEFLGERATRQGAPTA